jgi:hypothetical protein
MPRKHIPSSLHNLPCSIRFFFMGRIITEHDITSHLMVTRAGSPPLDILVRTSGVKRLSDFMLWQASPIRTLFNSLSSPLFISPYHRHLYSWRVSTTHQRTEHLGHSLCPRPLRRSRTYLLSIHMTAAIDLSQTAVPPSIAMRDGTFDRLCPYYNIFESFFPTFPLADPSKLAHTFLLE